MASMDSIAYNKVQTVARKAKKKQVKGELDRLKQAEKKKRRLEKALATSAAIRSELEKKKQKKKEEQQRLDEEGAAIAEAVALHVLLDEDSDDSGKSNLNKEKGFNSWDCVGNINLYMDKMRTHIHCQDSSQLQLESLGWLSGTYENGNKWAAVENPNWSLSFGSLRRDLGASYWEDGDWGSTELSAGLVAAQAVSSLQIAEDADVDAFIFNEVLRL